MKILMMATYPWDKPRHGGQHRMHNIHRRLVDAGHEVQAIGVLGSDHYAMTPGFSRYPGNSILSDVLKNPTMMEDWGIGELFAKDDGYFSSLFSSVSSQPDVILVCNPWLFEAAQKFANQCEIRPHLVYDAQNVESSLKFGIIQPRLGEETAREYELKVLKTEISAVKGADLISCVSEEDKNWLNGHATCPVIVARNGVIDRIASKRSIEISNEISGGRKFALYCGSAHPPNIDGFYDMFGGGIGCFAPGQKLIVAGGAGLHIKNSPKFSQTSGLNAVYIDAGEVSESCLAGLLQTAHAIILPVTHGGGTNLKAAEAIWARAHVVTTSTAMRGFDQFSTLEAIRLANDGQKFRAALRDVMMQPPLRVSDSERSYRSSVLWDKTLTELVATIGAFGKIDA